MIKICANPETYARLSDDMDINAGRILQGTPLVEVGDEIYDRTLAVAGGIQAWFRKARKYEGRLNE